MCSINHDLKAIFIHVHKTGGTYLSYMLHKYYGFKNYYLRRPDHDSFCLNKKKTTKYINYENRIHGVLIYYKTSPQLNKKMGMNLEKWNSYYKFCFIRNPYDKIISAWNHINRYKIPFNNYLNLRNICNDVEYMHMFLPQVRNIINQKGNIDINFIGKFENLEEDFHTILRNIGIKNIIHDVNKQMNKREHLDFYEYYNQEILDKVNRLLVEDFKKLDYEIITDINIFKETFNKRDIILEINHETLYDNEKEILEEQDNPLKYNKIYINNQKNILEDQTDILYDENDLLKYYNGTLEDNNLLYEEDTISLYEENNDILYEDNNENINLNYKEDDNLDNKDNIIENKICCFYVYYEKDKSYKYNFTYFLNNGILDNIDYYIIINGICTVKIPNRININVLQRDNKGYDFGAYSYAISKLENKVYEYYFFINTSVIGPYLSDNSKDWTIKFINLFKNNVKLVGTSINIYTKDYVSKYNLNSIYKKNKPFCHVQTMFFAIDNEYFNFLDRINFFNEEEINDKKFDYIITYKEIALSQIALNNGWNINCILNEYQGLDYIKLNGDINKRSINGDPYFKNAYFGKDIKKEDVIFFKINRFIKNI